MHCMLQPAVPSSPLSPTQRNANNAGYIFILAPNQTPTIDAFIVKKLVGLRPEDPYQVGLGVAATPGVRTLGMALIAKAG